MDNSSSEPSDKPDSNITSINDFPSVIKEFFSNLSIDVEKIGLKYLSVPATTAPIERIFSQSGFIMRPHRASLTDKNVCLLSFLKCKKVLL